MRSQIAASRVEQSPRSKTECPQVALLVLEDGTQFWGRVCGCAGETFGELVFNTGMTGYQEVLTDPSYCGQIVVMTYPEIGIYGVNPDDVESDCVQVAGFVVHHAVQQAFNYRATHSFTDYLCQAGITAIDGIDTRALTRRLRTQGAMRGAISAIDLDPGSLVARVRRSPSMLGLGLAQQVSTPAVSPATRFGTSQGSRHIVAVDAGIKSGIVRCLSERGVRVTLVPYNATVSAVIDLAPDGVLVSNGPGDPAPLEETIVLIRGLLEHRIPLAGICLGHQLLGLAIGGQTYKMRFGHRGSNHPIKDMSSGRVFVTTQNHGFAIDPTSLGIPWAPLDTAFQAARPEVLDTLHTQETTPDGRPATMAERLPDSLLIGESPLGFGPVEVTQLSLNDGTIEGIRLRDYPAFSVQYHPEASPGPHDADFFFDQFADSIEIARSDYA
ncbi:MAG: glutamine-hydrolyzing carbamoyl-phosphate synthase small subunit [Anaerolineae bacterium]|nr:glutamine-hydrolyzing carbamoyl-phosphate synthase small subunit [Anaerolineae bacterium]